MMMSWSLPVRVPLAWKFLDQLPDVEAVVVPVGGGGLLAGVAFAIKSLRPDVKIYGVQAAGAAACTMRTATIRMKRWTMWIPLRTALR